MSRRDCLCDVRRDVVRPFVHSFDLVVTATNPLCHNVLRHSIVDVVAATRTVPTSGCRNRIGVTTGHRAASRFLRLPPPRMETRGGETFGTTPVLAGGRVVEPTNGRRGACGGNSGRGAKPRRRADNQPWTGWVSFGVHTPEVECVPWS